MAEARRKLVIEHLELQPQGRAECEVCSLHGRSPAALATNVLRVVKPESATYTYWSDRRAGRTLACDACQRTARAKILVKQKFHDFADREAAEGQSISVAELRRRRSSTAAALSEVSRVEAKAAKAVKKAAAKERAAAREQAVKKAALVANGGPEGRSLQDLRIEAEATLATVDAWMVEKPPRYHPSSQARDRIDELLAAAGI